MSKDKDTLKFLFTLNGGTKWEEKSTVEIWCDGRKYDPSSEVYRPVYAYKINTLMWEYVDNDIHGAINELPDLRAAAQSLFAFLYACQEGMPKTGRFETNDNDDLFPPHVREWAHLLSDQISIANEQLRIEGEKK